MYETNNLNITKDLRKDIFLPKKSINKCKSIWWINMVDHP